MSQQGNKNPNRRFIGKVKQMQGQYGTFNKIYVDNPSPVNKDGTPNEFHKGNLLWLDADGSVYIVKQMSVRGVSDAQLQKGFVQSISVDLDDTYETEKKK